MRGRPIGVVGGAGRRVSLLPRVGEDLKPSTLRMLRRTQRVLPPGVAFAEAAALYREMVFAADQVFGRE